MANFKKIDDKDFEFVNKPLSENEEMAFSDFLKNRKTVGKRRSRVSAKKPRKKLVQ